jgi:hypothetical protein
VANFVLAYLGGGMPEGEAAQQAAMEEWMNWFGSLGDKVVDAGSPFGPSSRVASDRAVSDGGAAGLTGYSIISADSLAAANEAAKGCPVLSAGGSIDVYEVMPIG